MLKKRYMVPKDGLDHRKYHTEQAGEWIWVRLKRRCSEQAEQERRAQADTSLQLLAKIHRR
jgi:hypothetical protein